MRAVAKVKFVVRCTDNQCADREAKYKIAAEWSGGGYSELKTFGFADDECLERVFKAARERAAKIRIVEGEGLGDLRIYQLQPKRHDFELERMTQLEEQFVG